ncbi:MAG: T9SS type A sorting domain-containing protein [Bacteroidetes bacterium]|nr:T9SS type A sorting domain-containing protein [Bacteroidota bacterium]
MNRKLCLLFILLFKSHLTFCQQSFQKIFNSQGNCYGTCIEKTNDNGFIISGYSTSGSYSFAILIKTNSIGDTIWTGKYYGTCWYGSKAYTVSQLNNGNYIFTGSPCIGQNSKHYLNEIDSVGNLLGWSEMFGVNGTANEIIIKKNGGIALVGMAMGMIGGMLGGPLRTALFNPLSSMINPSKITIEDSLVFAPYYYGSSLKETPDSGIIILSNDGINASIYKIDSLNNVIWGKVLTGCNEGNFINKTSDGGFIVTGTTNTTQKDLYLLKIDSAGNKIWEKSFGGTLDDFGYYVEETSDSGFIIVGKTLSFGLGGSDVYLIKTDSIGNLEWSKTYGGTGDDEGKSLKKTTDGGYMITGTGFFNNSYKIYLIKVDGSGNSSCNESTPLTIDSTLVTSILKKTTHTGSPGTSMPLPDYFSLSKSLNIGVICTTLSSAEIETNNQPIFFPNPSKGEIFFQLNSEKCGNVKVAIINSLGKEVFFSNNILKSNDCTFSIATKIPPGVYFIRVNDAKIQYFQKLVITE